MQWEDDTIKKDSIYVLSFRTGGEARTPDTWFWRPVLYQLSYTPRDVYIVAYTKRAG